MPDAQTSDPQTSDSQTSDFPTSDPEINASVDAVAAFHEEHYRSATFLQRTMDAATDRLGRPPVAGFIVLVVLAWIGATFTFTNGKATQPSFVWLELAASVGALLVAMLILVTQRRQDELADRRAKLTLELAILADRKSAKTIALLEEMRRDAPGLHDRHDPESDALGQPADPKTVLDAIDRRAGKPKAGSAV